MSHANQEEEGQDAESSPAGNDDGLNWQTDKQSQPVLNIASNEEAAQQIIDAKKANKTSIGDSEGNNGARGQNTLNSKEGLYFDDDPSGDGGGASGSHAMATAMLAGGSSNANSRRGDSRPRRGETMPKSSQRALQE